VSKQQSSAEHDGQKGDSEEKGTKRAIYAAFFANLLIAISKFVAGFISGSSALLAEGAHSVADTTNQIFLLISLRFAKRAPDQEHPYGHGKDRFFWSLLVAFGLFVAGAVFSIYTGITAIMGESGGHHESFLIGYIVLGVAFVFESGALFVSVREFLHAAKRENRSFWGHFNTTRNTTMKVPLYEDVAASRGSSSQRRGSFLPRRPATRSTTESPPSASAWSSSRSPGSLVPTLAGYFWARRRLPRTSGACARS
jgi:hypothetical protein